MRHPTLLLATTLAVGLAVSALTAGCTSSPQASDTSHTTTAGTASPTALSEEDQAVADAEEAYREWSRVFYSCVADPPNADLSCFDEVSVGIQVDMDQSSLLQRQEAGWHNVGESRIASMSLVSVDLTDRVDRPADPDQGMPEQHTYPTVVFDVCLDMTGADLVDAAGVSQLPDDYVWHRRNLVSVQNRSYPDPAGWRVWNAYEKAETETCEP